MNQKSSLSLASIGAVADHLGHGLIKGRWWWMLEWMIDKNYGVCDTMQEALDVAINLLIFGIPNVHRP